MAATTRIDQQRQGHSRVRYNDRFVNSTWPRSFAFVLVY